MQMNLQKQDEDFHFKLCEIACLGSHATEMTIEEFFELQKCLEAGLNLKQSIEALPPSVFTLKIEKNDDLLREALDSVEICIKKKFRMIYPGHSLYPEVLLNIDSPPKLLTYVGEPAWLSTSKISVVGSREVNSDSVQWMELYFDSFLKKTRAVTVSGAAFGVDQLAHRISIRNLLPTIAFLPSGLAQIYPRRFAYDMDHLVKAKGAIVSEFLPQKEIRKSHFERRNRLISALSEVLFVVQAGRKSGSIMTARLALGQGKTLCVLTSSPSQSQNLGNLDLLFDGAHPLRDDKDLLAITDSLFR